MVSKFGLYAYGLVSKSPKQLNILGIDKKNKVYSVERRGICAIVSKINTDKFQDEIKKLLSKLTNPPAGGPNETEEILRGHEDVVDALMKLTTVVPFKFGTILKDEAAVSKMLQEYEEKFKKLLSKFTGKEEWGLKVYTDNQEFKKRLIKSDPKLKELAYFRAPARKQGAPFRAPARKQGAPFRAPARKQGAPCPSGQGRTYLLGRKMEEELKNHVSTRLARTSEVIFQEAGKDAYEAKLNEPVLSFGNKTLPQKLTGKNKEMILNTAYLIEKEKVAHFCKQVKKLIEKYESMGIEIELSGPWPPYSFT